MNDDIKSVNNLIPLGYQNALEELFSNEMFEWGYTKDIVWQNNQDKLKQLNDGLSHLVHVPKYESKYWPFIRPILYYIEDKFGVKVNSILRVRIGMLLKAYPDDLPWNNEHVDNPAPHYTAIYYVNETGGPTYIFDQRITDVPHKNKTEDQVLKYVNSTDFTVAHAMAPKKGSCVMFDGLRFHASSKPKEHSNRIVIAINWK